MRLAPVTVCAVLLLGASPGLAVELAGDNSVFAGGELRDVYDYEARRKLVEASRVARDYGAAYYHSAWLSWLAPRRYAESEAGLPYLRDQRNRDRAAEQSGTGSAVSLIMTSMEASRLLHNTCLNGSIARQAARLRVETEKLVLEAERIESELGVPDPVARSALVHLYLALDDVLSFEETMASVRSRRQVLRGAVTRAATVTAWLPKSPGAHRAVAVIRARLAELEGRAELWHLAIAEAERAHELDPEDSSTVELLWTLSLRAGRWDEAREWQRGLEKMAAGECAPN